MKALLLKDVYNIAHNLKTLLVMLAVMGAVFLYSGGVETFTVVVTVIFGTMVITTMSMDEASKWNRYALAMPVRRRDIVREKYLLQFCFCLVGMLLGLAIAVVAGLLRQNLALAPLCAIALAGVGVSLLAGSVLIPLLYKFGAEKARMLLMLVYLIPMGIGFLLQYLLQGRSLEGVGAPLRVAPYVAPALVLAAVYLSYRVSLRIFEKLEF